MRSRHLTTSGDPISDDPSKVSLRKKARATRAALSVGERESGSALVGQHFFQWLKQSEDGADAALGAYWPLSDEVDCRGILDKAVEDGIDVALPRVVGRDQALTFRQWRPGDRLEPGAHGTQHPSEAAAVVRPRIFLVPLLAFDRRGYRLGYGGGYFDRTLNAARRERAIVAVGLAFSVQEVAMLPVEAHDQRMDWVMTEKEVIACAAPL